MTTLYNNCVKRTKAYVVHHQVSGDLSHSFKVRTPDMIHQNWMQGVGIPARSLEEAVKVGKLVERIGYNKAYEYWRKKVMKSGYNFGYLPKSSKLARSLAPYAYGDYAKEIRKKYKLRRKG